MGYTKRQFVEEAFAEIGMASYVFDLQPQQLEGALRRLDTMLATWNGKGIRIGYPLPSSPEDSDLDTETLVPDAANEAIITNLAVRIAPQYGKSLSMDTKVTAKQSYDMLLSRAAMPMEMQLPASMPRGAGAKAYDDPFVDNPEEPILAGRDGQLEF
jgi:hypothetical protein